MPSPSYLQFFDLDTLNKAAEIIAKEIVAETVVDRDMLRIYADRVYPLAELIEDIHGIIEYTSEASEEEYNDAVADAGPIGSEDDGEALASAGFGTDEDYGGGDEHI